MNLYSGDKEDHMKSLKETAVLLVFLWHCSRVGNSLFCSKLLILKSDCEWCALVALYKRATGAISSFLRANCYFALLLTKNKRFTQKPKSEFPTLDCRQLRGDSFTVFSSLPARPHFLCVVDNPGSSQWRADHHWDCIWWWPGYGFSCSVYGKYIFRYIYIFFWGGGKGTFLDKLLDWFRTKQWTTQTGFWICLQSSVKELIFC